MSSIFGFRSGQASVRLDIDHDSRLKNGSIEYFSPLKDGGVLALVRTVAQYNTIDGASTTPKLYADTFSVIFDPVGTVSNITQLRIPSSAQVTGLGHLKNGWLVAGYTHDSTFITVLAYLLDEAGNLIKDIPLPNSRGTSSRTGHAESVGVFRPTVLPTAEGDLLLLRGFSNQPIYRFSETGQLLLTTKLQPDGIDFWFSTSCREPAICEGGRIPREAHRQWRNSSGSVPIVISGFRSTNRRDYRGSDVDGLRNGGLFHGS